MINTCNLHIYFIEYSEEIVTPQYKEINNAPVLQQSSLKSYRLRDKDDVNYNENKLGQRQNYYII